MMAGVDSTEDRPDPPGQAAPDRPADERTRREIEAVFRLEWARLVAGLARYAGDVGIAEDRAQDALLAAMEQWPTEGIPANPGAWLMTVAKRRSVDLIRRDQVYAAKLAVLGRDLADVVEDPTVEADARLDDHIGDDLLRLIFVACHPLLSPPARVALTLRLLGGLTTAEIARAFLIPESTVAQRIVRAKRTLSESGVPFAVPVGDDFAARLPSVLATVYLIFNEGYTATAGESWMRPDLCLQALRLGRLLGSLVPDQPEVHGLAALMELQASRIPARTGPAGRPVLLAEQNRARWDSLLIRRGLDGLRRVDALGGASGYYALQAAIAACHAVARGTADTDWARIAALYGMLATGTGSPIIEVNRAVAVAMHEGPQAGLDILDAVADDPALRGYHLLPSVRGDLLVKLGRGEEASAEFRRAATLTHNERERALLLDRARALSEA
jgi:RNA polymerase sigma factor (sigma-70 family)